MRRKSQGRGAALLTVLSMGSNFSGERQDKSQLSGSQRRHIRVKEWNDTANPAECHTGTAFLIPSPKWKRQY